GQKSHCVITFSGHHNAMFLLNSRIPLVRFSSELIVNRAGVSPFRGVTAGPHGRRGRSTRTVKSAQSGPRTPGSRRGPRRTILSANPFAEATDPICRLPVSTMFYGPEAANLGALMPLWVRSGAK